MRNKIAEIRLAPGQVGFYDELTNIHLTLTKPYAPVYQGMNTSGLQRSVNSKRLILTWGSLRPAPVSMSEEAYAIPKAPAKPAVEKVKVVEATPVVEKAELNLEVEEVTEVQAEEAVTEEAPKTTKKKAATKKKEVKEEE